MSNNVKGYQCLLCGFFEASTLLIGKPPTTCRICGGKMVPAELPPSAMPPSVSANVRCGCGFSVGMAIGMERCPKCGAPL